MSDELLSICIPTRNRAKFLREILGSFARQIDDGEIGADQVVFYISDNASDDGETPDIIRGFEQKVPKAVCSRNAVNIGGDANNVHIRTLARGKYLWVIGDDELLCAGAVATILKLIEEHTPGLIIAFDTNYDLKIPAQIFPDYRAFAQECVRRNTHALAEHTLISCNIFRADCYDIELGKKTVGANFPHMFGMIRPLMQKKAAVILAKTPIITVRKRGRPGPPDGHWVDLDMAWLNYFKWLREELPLPELDPTAPNASAREAMIERMKKHPVRFLANNWRSIFQPQAYRFVFNRFFRKVR